MTSIDKSLRGFLAGGNTGVFEASLDGSTVRCEFSSIDSMACAIAQLAVDFAEFRTAENLRETCDALATKLNYLLEPIQIIECDAELSTIQMRSNPPQADEKMRRYYELTATPSRLVLSRFEKQPGQSRRSIESVLTQEVAVRLIGDLASA